LLETLISKIQGKIWFGEALEEYLHWQAQDRPNLRAGNAE
jgi:hypothetical protein